jgi:ABC-2 type transport system ATP-binding protein
MSIAIQVRGVRKAFGGVPVLDGVDLDVGEGMIFALLGPNGAGKTTLISILATLVAPDAGTAAVAGYDVTTEPDSVRGVIALTGQSAAVDEVYTGEENLRMMGRLFGLGRRDAVTRARQLIAQFGLVAAARKPVKTYSGGMRRRLDIAMCLIVPSAVLFLDEPTTGLDPRSRVELWEVIRTLSTNGTTVFLTTQYLEEADQLADRIALINDGRVVVEGSPAALKSATGGEVVELYGPDEQLIREIPTDGTLTGLRQAIDRLEAEGIAGSVAIRKPSLDDVFLTLTAHEHERVLVDTKG